MDVKLLNLLKEKTMIIPKILFSNYKKLNISDSELILLIYIINLDNKIRYNPEVIANDLDLDKFKVMEIVNSLEEKNIIDISIEKENKEEYLIIDSLYQKLLNIILNKKEEKSFDDIFSIFEQEFGRTLSPMEYEIIKGWINQNISKELIVEALKEATYNGVNNLRYIEKIVYEWNKKGLKSKSDILRDHQKYQKNKKEKVEVFDYNWLEDE